jgi:hypothetical protein
MRTGEASASVRIGLLIAMPNTVFLLWRMQLGLNDLGDEFVGFNNHKWDREHNQGIPVMTIKTLVNTISDWVFRLTEAAVSSASLLTLTNNAENGCNINPGHCFPHVALFLISSKILSVGHSGSAYIFSQPSIAVPKTSGFSRLL